MTDVDVRKLFSRPTTIISPFTVCRDLASYTYEYGNHSTVLVVVHSDLKHRYERRTIRHSWALDQKVLPHIRVIFLIERKGRKQLPLSIYGEQGMYKDILFEHVVYNQFNMTVKSMVMLKWFLHNCPTVDFLVKATDGAYVNLKQLSLLADSLKDQRKILYGELIKATKSTFSLNYLRGIAYLMSRDTVQYLFIASLTTRLSHMEDVFITGITAHRAEIIPRNHSKFQGIKTKWPLDPCQLRMVISVTGLTGEQMQDMYELMNDERIMQSC